MSALTDLQQRFPPLLAKLIEWGYQNGYTLAMAEAYRSPEQAALNAQHGSGIANSLHTLRLAVDIMAYKNGAWLQDSEDYRPLGEFWKTLAPECCWGGDFAKPDGDHFSMTWGGFK